MQRITLFLLIASLTKGVDAFSTSSKSSSPYVSSRQSSNQPRHVLNLHNNNDNNDNILSNLSSVASSFAAACAIFSGVALSNPAVVNAAADKVELSTGSIIVRTSYAGLPSSDKLIKAEIDSKSLLTTAFKNRQAIKSSLERIASVAQDEITNRPVWRELAKEVLDIEGDVLPEITVRPPADLKQTITDLSKGRLNLLVNNEVVNLSVEPTFSQDEEELVFRIRGFNGANPNALPIPATPPVQFEKGPISKAFEGVEQIWNAPFMDKEDSTLTNGEVTLGGGVATIAAAYAVSYQYYTDEMNRAEREAEEKQQAIAAKKKKAAEASGVKVKKIPAEAEAKKKAVAEAEAKKKAAAEAEAREKAAAEEEAKKKAAAEEEAKKKAAAEEEAKKKAASEEEAKKKAAEEEEAKAKAAEEEPAKMAEDEKEEEEAIITEEEESGDSTPEGEVKTRKHRFRFWKNKKSPKED